MTTAFEGALASMPVFPLPSVVLFPGAALPLHVFEPRYRVMLKDSLDSHRALAIGGRIEPGAIIGGGLVVEHHALADGRSNILVVGEARLRIEELELEDLPRFPYLRARVSVVRELEGDVPVQDRTALVAAATMFAGEVKRHDASFSFAVPSALTAAELADVCAYQLIIDPAARQAVLEDLDPRSRVERVTSQLAFQHGAIRKQPPDTVLN